MPLNTAYSVELLANAKLSNSEEHSLSATRICLIPEGCLHVWRHSMTCRKGATWHDSTFYISTSKDMTAENFLHIWETSRENRGPSRPTWLTIFFLFLNTSLQFLGYQFKINDTCPHPHFFFSSPTKQHFTPGVYESRRLVTRATKFCTVRPNILGIIIPLLVFTHSKVISPHASSRTQQVIVRFKGRPQIVVPRHGNVFVSPFWGQELGSD